MDIQPNNFIEDLIAKDLAEGANDGRLQTRFPPEPNGYLHIGHAKAVCMDFGAAEKFGGVCNLRFDDTNPTKEDVEYVDAIKEDINWLGFKWGNIYYASDYFQQLWDLAVKLIKDGKAYVDEQSAEEIARQKGTPAEKGKESPYRNRPVEENLRLFEKMNSGEVPDGAMVLRAKIDMASPNMHFRDPIMYRIITKHPHHRTGTKWKAYPMYDFAHGQSDYFEGVTHSICTLEFVVHRPLYDWFIDQFAEPGGYRPHQYEFNRLNITYTVMSKRKLLQLVQEGLVAGWDDPRMPTICGLRRRGYTPESIRNFIGKIGYTTYEATIDLSLLEAAAREDLKQRSTRVCAIFDPVKMVITNYPEGKTEKLTRENNPDDDNAGDREVDFSGSIFIERSDFMENAPKDFFRPGFNPLQRRFRAAKAQFQIAAVKNPAVRQVFVLIRTVGLQSKALMAHGRGAEPGAGPEAGGGVEGSAVQDNFRRFIFTVAADEGFNIRLHHSTSSSIRSRKAGRKKAPIWRRTV